jgi:hypothetical protein
MKRIILAGSLALLAAPAVAQSPLTARSLGMAGSFVADARGVDALFFNPANLGLHGTPYWSVSVPQLVVGTKFTGTHLSQLPSLLNFNKWSAAEKDAFVGGIPSEGLNTKLSVNVPIFAIQERRFAFGVSYATWYDENVGRDVMDLLVNGYQPGRTDYAVGNTGGRNASWIDVSGGWGHAFGKVSVGVAGHYLLGRAIAREKLFEPTFDVERQDLSAELREVSVHGGHGWGVDLGVAAEPAPRLTVSASVTNAFSGMKWSSDIRTKGLVLTKADFKRSGALDAWDRFDQSEAKVDPSAVPVTVYETAAGLLDRAWIPATLHAGVAYALPGEKTRVSASYQGALDDGALSAGWRREISAGAEHRMGLVTLRAGAGTDGAGALMLAGGAGLGGLHLGVAHTSEPNGSARASGWTFAFGLSGRNLAPMP